MGREIPLKLVIGSARDRLGRPLHDLRISLMDRCNFRCPYCMPAERFPEHHAFLPSSARMNDIELLLLVEAFVALGVRKLRLTGGEPLLVRQLEALISTIKQRWPHLELALTTNGSLLAARAAGLKAAGLDRLTVSLDAIEPGSFRLLNGGRGELGVVLEGIQAARRAGFTPIKLNCVVIRGKNEHQILPLVEHFRGTETILRFIEYMDVGTVNHWAAAEVLGSAEILARIATTHPVEELPRVAESDVAARWRLRDGSLELGLISSVSQPFCGSCARARLSADGQLFTCLFAEQGHDLLKLVRSGIRGIELERLVRTIWGDRSDRYSEQRADLIDAGPKPRPEMYHLGG